MSNEKKGNDTLKNIESGVVGAYKKIEEGVVSAYKKVEQGAVDTFHAVEDACVSKLFAKDGETTEDAKKRLRGESGGQE